MLKSMTGYGRITRVLGDKKISCEIKSLNSKQIDINFKLPANYREYELEYRSLIAKHIVRGKVDVVVAVEEDSLKNRPLINKSVIKAYYEQIKNISNDISINTSLLYIHKHKQNHKEILLPDATVKDDEKATKNVL